jgi:hypothetical protein
MSGQARTYCIRACDGCDCVHIDLGDENEMMYATLALTPSEAINVAHQMVNIARAILQRTPDPGQKVQ